MEEARRPCQRKRSNRRRPPLSNYFISNDKFSREAIQPANRTNNFQSSVGPVSRHHRSRTRTTRSFSQETAKRKGPREERKRKKMKEQKEKQRNWSRGRERRTAGGSSRRLVSGPSSVPTVGQQSKLSSRRRRRKLPRRAAHARHVHALLGLDSWIYVAATNFIRVRWQTPRAHARP